MHVKIICKNQAKLVAHLDWVSVGPINGGSAREESRHVLSEVEGFGNSGPYDLESRFKCVTAYRASLDVGAV